MIFQAGNYNLYGDAVIISVNLINHEMQLLKDSSPNVHSIEIKAVHSAKELHAYHAYDAASTKITEVLVMLKAWRRLTEAPCEGSERRHCLWR